MLLCLHLCYCACFTNKKKKLGYMGIKQFIQITPDKDRKLKIFCTPVQHAPVVLCKWERWRKLPKGTI